MRLIDADELCKHLHELKTGDKDTVYEYYDYGIDTAISTVAVFPTIEAEPVRRGRWEWIGGYGPQYRCSECIKCAERRTKYCPHCGAKMDMEGGEA